MATTTKAVLRNRVLEELGVLAAGETANSNDADVVDARIELINDQYIENGVSHWATSAIPDYAVEPLITITAARCAPAFGLNENVITRLKMEAVGADVSLRGVTSKKRGTESVYVPEAFY